MIKVKAPGRVCLFGDHQDYLGLPIIACAIDKHIYLEAVPNQSQVIKIQFIDINENRAIAVPIKLENYDPKDAFTAVLKVLQKQDCFPNKGYDITIKGAIPINAGLSSSSALLLVWIGFLVGAFGKGKQYHQEELAKIAYEAEVLERNGPGGKMDQYSIALGHIIYLETNDNASYKTFKRELPGLIIGESGISKDTLGLLADRRSLAIEALRFLENQLPSFDIKKVTLSTIGTYTKVLPNHLSPYFNAAINNYLITQKALLEFQRDKLHLKSIGVLMSAHHLILKNDLKITVPRIDHMIDAAVLNGAYGAKIVGSGGGGCIVALVPEQNEELVINALKKAGAVNAYKVSVSEGIIL
ncbi:galactokinase family protein [Croceitalea rosinachiae]|uniref:Galactokinase family protein n=1 Tax=Croceitalea rosinachiae TaxID=3075596 RepID=A0ABU3ABF9_9FLAO|nr:galactokinase family protein [Croceitalea sp. F388]MDT0606433.1 galactokinase family protein [Croceitalea sp. F388]